MEKKNNMTNNNTRQSKASLFDNTHSHYTYIQPHNSGSGEEWDNCGDELDT